MRSKSQEKRDEKLIEDYTEFFTTNPKIKKSEIYARLALRYEISSDQVYNIIKRMKENN